MSYISGLATRGVSLRKVARKTFRSGSISYDPNFLGSGLARKLYVITDQRFQLKSPTHRHASPQMTCLIQGQDMRLAYEDEHGETVRLAMQEGHYVYIAPGVPHRVEVSGCFVLESFMPTSACIEWMISGRKNGVELLGPDFFTSRQDLDRNI